MKRLRFILIALVFITTFVFSAIFHPVQAIDPIPISTPEGLNDIRSNLSGHYQLTADIDMSTFGNWVPIGTYAVGFSGILDGNGHTIKSITISDSETDFIGLFGVIGPDGFVYDLQITNAIVEGNTYVSICTGINQGIIEKVATQGVIRGNMRVGGLVGFNEGTISNSYAITSITGNINIGGLVGYSAGSISNSYSASSIGNTNATNQGGLVGWRTGSVSNSYYDKNISGLDDTGKGIPFTTALMKAKESYADTWDFMNTWHIIRGETYPSLFPFSVTIERDPSQPEPASTSPINFIATFDEPIIKTSFSAEDVSLGGTAGADQLAITEIAPNDGTTFKLSVRGMTNAGTVSVSIPQGKVIDILHNFNDAGTSNIVSYEPDTTPPTVSISSTTTSPTNSSPISISISFSEDVIGFTVDDIQVTNGALENFSGSGKDYTADLIPDSDGTVTVNIPADVTEDAAGNGNTVASPFSINYDGTRPRVTMNMTFDRDPYNLNILIVNVSFNEKVIGFNENDFIITNGKLHSFHSIEDGKYFHVIFKLETDGLVTVEIPENVVTDHADNMNQASNIISFEYDSTRPTVTINQSTTQPDPTNSQPINFIATFSEPIVPYTFVAGDLTIDGITETPTITVTEIAPNDGTTFNIALSGLTQSDIISVSLLENKVVDLALNLNLQSTSTDNSVEYDITNPTVTISSSAPNLTNLSPIPISIDFSEEVVGFELTDIAVTNGSPSNLSGSGDSYTVDVTPVEEGLITIELQENIAVDLAGNPNIASAPFEITYDITNPSVSIEQAIHQTDPTNKLPILFSVTFSKPIFMESFTVDDFELQAPAGAAITSLSETEPYDETTFEISIDGMTEDGVVALTMPEGKVQDLAGNTNSASTSLDNSVIFDTTRPTATISSDVSSPTNLSTIPVTIEFSEPVFGFELDELAVTNGSTSNLTGSDDTYTAEIIPLEEGIVTVMLPSEVATDTTGNENTESLPFTIEFDVTSPSVTVEQSIDQADPTNNSPVHFTATFSEPIDKTSLSNEDVFVEGSAEASGITITEISATSFDIAIGTIPKSGSIEVNIPAEKVNDLAGNVNTASISNDNIVTYDSDELIVSIEKSEIQPDPTNITPILFTVQFNKPINLETFTYDDFLLVGPEGTKLTGITDLEHKDETTFEVKIDGMTEDGVVALTMPEGMIHDLAGNTNSASTSLDNSVIFDTQSPQVENLDIEKFYEGNPPEQFTITFSEAMYNPEGDADPDDVTNPPNYLLVEWGENATFDTISCKDGWQEDDKLIKISSATYDEEAFATTLKLPYKLTEGSYRLFVCGSTTLYDAAMNPLNDGLDSIFGFLVLPEPEEEDNNQSPALLPETGFPIGQTTLLAKQQASQQYKSTDLKLEITSAGIRTSIIGVPLVNGDWEVSWLGNQVGYLYGSAYPTWQGNTVLTGHVWNANNTPGIFFNLKTLKYGDLIHIHAYGVVYTYEVRENRLISETNLKAAFQSEEYDWVTLLTCEGYQPNDKTYVTRRMVRAVLVSVE